MDMLYKTPSVFYHNPPSDLCYGDHYLAQGTLVAQQTIADSRAQAWYGQILARSLEHSLLKQHRYQTVPHEEDELGPDHWAEIRFDTAEEGEGRPGW